MANSKGFKKQKPKAQKSTISAKETKTTSLCGKLSSQVSPFGAPLGEMVAPAGTSNALL